jgi:hypothetical protein
MTALPLHEQSAPVLLALLIKDDWSSPGIDDLVVIDDWSRVVAVMDDWILLVISGGIVPIMDRPALLVREKWAPQWRRTWSYGARQSQEGSHQLNVL